MSERVTLATLDIRLEAVDLRMSEFGEALNRLNDKLDSILVKDVVRRIEVLEKHVDTVRDLAIIAKVEAHEKFKWLLLSTLAGLGAALILALIKR